MRSEIPQAQRWLILNSGPGEPAWNMALDEALLNAVAAIELPVLRFYGWIVPAATFGYFQRYADVAGMTPLRPLIRRPTGGGLVPHEADWTYSLAFPPSHEWYRLRAAESYQRLHEWIRASLARLRVVSELAPESKKELPGCCFAGPEKSDLLCQGRKLAGAAQRRTRQGLLIQGSIQPPPPSMSRVVWENAFCKTAVQQWGVAWIPFHETHPLTPALSPGGGEGARRAGEGDLGIMPGQQVRTEHGASHLPAAVDADARRLSEAKYSRPDYNERR